MGEKMNGWIEVQMLDKKMDEWMTAWVDGWMEVQMDG